MRGAAEATDFTLPARTIGERRMPLVHNTMRKIEAGWAKYRRVHDTGSLIPPYMIELHGGGSSHRLATQPMSTLTAGGINHGVVYADPPVHELLPYYGNSSTQPVAAPMPTLTPAPRARGDGPTVAAQRTMPT